MISLYGDDRVLGVVFNAALIDSGLHEPVTFVSIPSSIAVAHDPVVGAILVAVPNNVDCVVHCRRTGIAVDARSVG